MDAILSAAVEEICLEGPSGVPPPRLWTLLHPSISAAGLQLCNAVKRTLWTRLVALPSLHLHIDGARLSPEDPRIACPDAAEELGVKVVAEEHLRDSCLGIQELKAAGKKFSDLQRGFLERIALSRCNGVTQDQLGKDFGVNGKDVFYHLKGLESNGLIVRLGTVVKKGISVVNTNSLYLTRYARRKSGSNPHERVEITLGSESGDQQNVDGDQATGGDGSLGLVTKDDVKVMDYLPAMKEVCEKLEQASGKVLVVSDLKKELGYRKTKGHRLWRYIVNRLKEAKLVEEFHAKVDGSLKRKGMVEKSHTCLRLLKKFNSKVFQPKSLTNGCNDSNSENYLQCHSKKRKLSEQVMELPLDHQIYDMIDGEGSNGIVVTEIYRRLGINGKKNYPRILDMRSRFQMPMLAECHNKTKLYRIWTSGNDPHTDTSKSKEHPNDGQVPAIADSNPCLSYSCTLKSTSEGDGLVRETGKVKYGEIVSQLVELTGEAWSSAPKESEKYPCLDCTSISLQRKERIISRLEKDKFVLFVEMQKWLDTLETEKSSKMDKKTLLRVVETLEKDGLCKHIEFRFPSSTNPSNDRQISVIFHPSSVASISENLGEIYKKLRNFDMTSRCKGFGKAEGSEIPTEEIISIDRPPGIAQGLRTNFNSEAMRANGYIPAKMIRAKLLHIFLWSFLRNMPNWKSDSWNGSNDATDSSNSLKIFILDIAIKALPVELFLQVVGFAGQNDYLVEYCQKGLKLSDLQIEEYRCLMDTTASARLSALVDILVRLKLIHLLTKEGAAAADIHTPIIVSHALDLKPYIEIPHGHPCLDNNSHHLITNLRQYFNFLERDKVDDYWMTLEDYYAEVDRKGVSLTFPGSTVHEGFSSRAWSCVRLMSSEQRLELAKRVADSDPGEKVSFITCRGVAKELNLTLGQVLCAYYDRRSSHLCRSSSYTKSTQKEESAKTTDGKDLLKRKRLSKYNTEGHVQTNMSEDSQICDADMENLSSKHFKLNCDDPTTDSIVLEADNENRENPDFINQRLTPKAIKQKRFFWNDELDRQLVMQYARYRAVHKAELHRVPWVSLSNLPASPHTCRRRMAQLKGITSIRNAIMSLCNILGARYLMFIHGSSGNRLERHDGSNESTYNSLLKIQNNISSMPREMGSDAYVQPECWDNFDDPEIKVAVDEVLRCKNLIKQGNTIEDGSTRKRKFPGRFTNNRVSPEQNHFCSLDDGQENIDLPAELNEGPEVPFDVGSRKRFCAHPVPRRVLKLLSNKSIGTTKHVTESLAIANAIELLKLIFLSTSSASNVQASLVQTLRQYSENDIFAAFNYLKEKSFMIVGYGSRPFVLSQSFLHGATYSPFPLDTGRRACKFSNWLNKHKQDNIELYLDVQCGDIFHLFALVSTGRLNISAHLPEEGIGEVDDSFSKQDKSGNLDEIKKNVFLWKDSDLCLRREKGFPGIMVVLDCINDIGWESVIPFMFRDNVQTGMEPKNIAFSVEDDTIPSGVETSMSESLWQTIASYVEKESERIFYRKTELVSSDIIKSVYLDIQQTGEEGLNIDKVTENITTIHGISAAEFIVDTLEMFRLIIRVNAYDSVHLVDSSHKSKYFISIPRNSKNDCGQFSSVKLQPTTGEGHMGSLSKGDDQTSLKDDKELKIPDSYNKASIDDLHKNYAESFARSQSQCDELGSKRGGLLSSLHEESSSFKSCPILPWIDVNIGNNRGILYKGLVRRVLGTVMQNPGMLEEDLIRRMDILNPQSCRQLIELMILDNHITVRKTFQTPSTPPSILQGIIRPDVPKSKPLFRRHLFANPMSTKCL